MAADRRRARKRFGQNFLHDRQVLDHIMHAVDPRPDDRIIEIGPGRGALTELLLEQCRHLDVIEIDRDLALLLSERFGGDPAFTLHNTDVLKFDFASLPAPENGYRVIGNLPYNISTPLLFRLLRFQPPFRDMTFMLQLEVVDRMAAAPGGKNYGRLSVMAQYYCRVEKLFKVPPAAFVPQPKVVSAMVRLTPHGRPPWPARDPAMLEAVVRTAFSQRRKTLRNSLKTFLGTTELEALGIDGGRRPETLSLQEYVTISNSLGQ